MALPTMEAFTLLNYWHTGSAAGDSTFIASPYPGDGEGGPYFDLDLPISSESVNNEKAKENEAACGDDDDDELLAVKFEADDDKEIRGPLFSLFARDDDNKDSSSSSGGGGLKHKLQDSNTSWATKEVMQKYLKMLKPLYFRVSSHYFEKKKCLEQVTFPGGGGDSPPCTAVSSNARTTYLKQGSYNNNINLQAGLKVVRKHLGKSRSASATVAPPPPAGKMVGPSRRDGSLLQLEDGIQGAILHCKRSSDSCRDKEPATLSGSGHCPVPFAPAPFYYEGNQTDKDQI